MINKYFYWYFEKALPEKLCDRIVKLGKSTKSKNGKINSGKKLKNNKDVRNSNVVWLDKKWIYESIIDYLIKANKNAGWNFDFDFTEPAQFTIYKNKQFYDWHVDTWHDPYENRDANWNGKVRKISCTVQLTDPSEYTGGELEFTDGHPTHPSTRICTEAREKGSIVVFPSFQWHRVKPVTKGTRYSLVLWSCGYPFK